MIAEQWGTFSSFLPRDLSPLSLPHRNAAGNEILSHPVTEPFVGRLLPDGMSETTVLHRLFEDQLAGGPFPEAESILWIMHQETLSKTTLRLEVISSGYWLDPLNDVNTYVSDTPNRSQEPVRELPIHSNVSRRR